MNLLERLGLNIPLVQAPMAGTSTPELAAEVSNAGALGSIAVGATDAAGARDMIAQLRARTDRAFNVNVFVQAPAVADPAREAAWTEWLRPLFAEFGAEPPEALRPIYRSFAEDAEMQALLVEQVPPVVSFHFGLPPAPAIAALRERGVLLLASATSLAEARACAAAGIDVVVAQGIEAGGHRGMFDPAAPDDALGTMVLTRLLAREGPLPVIAAGGIMDGAGIAAALDLGAVAAQLGTAFVGCPESAADAAYRSALAGEGAWHTVLTPLISGRPARAGEPLHGAGGGGPPGAGLPHRLRCRQSPQRGREGARRAWFRRPMGRAGRTAGARHAGGPAGGGAARGTGARVIRPPSFPVIPDLIRDRGQFLRR